MNTVIIGGIEVEIPMRPPLWWDGLNIGPPAVPVDMDIDPSPIIYYDLPQTFVNSELYTANTFKASLRGLGDLLCKYA